MAKKNDIQSAQVNELVLQALETERGGVKIYETAVRCAVNDDLRKEWKKYLDQTRNHVQIVEGLCGTMKLDPEKETPGRGIVRHIGGSLVKAMEMALAAGDSMAQTRLPISDLLPTLRERLS